MATVQSDLVVREVRIAARPETVFGFLTDPALMTRWMGRQAELDPRPGGVFRVEVNDESTAQGEFLEVIPNESVAFSFGWEPGEIPVPLGSSVVKITLSPDGDATLLRLEHSGLTSDDARNAHDHGWIWYTDRLAAVAEGRDPGPDLFATPRSQRPE